MSGYTGFPSSAANYPEPPSGNAELQKRLDDLNNVDTKIAEVIKCAQTCISELAKDKQISRTKMEEASQNFRKTLNVIDTTMTAQLDYLANVCVGSAHQGSMHASVQNMALLDEANEMMREELLRIAAKANQRDEDVKKEEVKEYEEPEMEEQQPVKEEDEETL
ncbi:hypothetical protein L596_024955 [Steinernema carpocapsae]|nr:hypothetical protein L596_024955 [Steinernema carpocapsae]